TTGKTQIKRGRSAKHTVLRFVDILQLFFLTYRIRVVCVIGGSRFCSAVEVADFVDAAISASIFGGDQPPSPAIHFTSVSRDTGHVRKFIRLDDGDTLVADLRLSPRT